MTNTPRALLIEDYQAKCAKMEDDMLGWKESAEAWERDARGLSDRLKMLEALAREPGAIFESVERILDDESAWVSRPSEAVSHRIALAAMMIAERKMKLEFAPFVDALRLILPLAKGYAAEHQVGSNATYVRQAELLLDEKPLPGGSCI